MNERQRTMGSVEFVQAQGTSLGGRWKWLPAFVDYRRLKKRVKPDMCLAVVYGNETLGLSASPVTCYKEFKLIRNSPIVQQITYYSIEPALIGL